MGKIVSLDNVVIIKDTLMIILAKHVQSALLFEFMCPSHRI